MISLPIIDGVPSALGMPMSDSLAARCALAIAAPGPIAPVRKRNALVEQRAFIREASAWLERATAGLQIFKPALHFTLGQAIACDCTLDAGGEPITVWLCNAGRNVWGARWTLDQRWKALERAAPRLAPTAFSILCDSQVAAGAPLYTPRQAVGYAEWVYWMGESDETEILAEYLGQENDDEVEKLKQLTREQVCDRFNIISRAYIDRELPPAVTDARRSLTGARLEKIARRTDAAGKTAAAALELAAAARRAVRSGGAYALHREQDESWAIGTAATLRWAANDPMAMIFDDHANHLYEGASAVEEAWGWYVVKRAEHLPRLFRQLERQFPVMQAMEKLLPLIATRSGSDE